ncbi:enoyl-CoA hydratase/isomerase family protein [Sagittula sp. NFXS13]|uniref:enoyl-CoA hydratase-related protein n=1 Tax=Sagittula sp. NFXS13 TaxID=2819095 RepID=UPI0032E0062B
MAEGLHYSVHEGVAILSVDNPPVNALSHAVRVSLMEALARAEADEQVQTIVLMGTGPTFPAGANLTEYESGLRAPFLRDVCAKVEDCPKLVVAALHGTVYGGGLELALAAHYRLALDGARASLPEVRMGLTPSAGATQRLPRLVGTALALDMMISGATWPMTRGPGLALVDETCTGDLRAGALAYAQRLQATGHGPRRTRDLRDGFADYRAHGNAIATRRAKLTDEESAAAQVLHLVEAAPLLPFETGIAMEEDAFVLCLASDAARALRHAFTAERLARRFALPKGTVQPAVNRIAVLGQGTLAMQIAVSALNAGIGVNWGARSPDMLQDGVEQLRDVLAAGVKGGGLSPEQSQARLKLLHWGDAAEMMGGADMIIDAARDPFDMPAPRGAVRAVATSAQVDALGLRFAPPVFSTRLVEIVQGPGGTAEQVAYGLALAERMHKVPVHVRSAGESVVGTLAAAMHRAADGLLDLGADPYEVDTAVEAWGWTRAPFRSRDMSGLEEWAKAPRAEGAENWSALLVEIDRFGWVSGQGFYDWTDDGAQPAGGMRRLLNGQRRAQKISPETLVMLLVGAMANAGARMVSQGMVHKASDIDAVAILALDFPRVKGGPMMAAGQWGMLKVMKLLERLDHPDHEFWRPDPSWAERIKYGRTFLSK